MLLNKVSDERLEFESFVDATTGIWCVYDTSTSYVPIIRRFPISSCQVNFELLGIKKPSGGRGFLAARRRWALGSTGRSFLVSRFSLPFFSSRAALRLLGCQFKKIAVAALANHVCTTGMPQNISDPLGDPTFHL